MAERVVNDLHSVPFRSLAVDLWAQRAHTEVMKRRTFAIIGTAAGAAVLATGTGAVLALQSDPKAPTVQLDTVDTASETTLEVTTTITDAPTSTVDVTVTTSAPVAPSTTEYVAPTTTLYIPQVIPDSGVCLTCSVPPTSPVPTVPAPPNP